MAEKEKSIILNTRDLVLLFVFFIIVLMIVFTIGLLVGKNFPGEASPQMVDVRLGQSPEERDLAALPQSGAKEETDDNLLRPPSIDNSLPEQKKATAERPSTTPPSKSPATNTPSPTTPTPVPTRNTVPPSTDEPDGALFCVQAFASPDYDKAKQKVTELKSRGFDAFVKIPEKNSADQFYRVQVGTFRNRENAVSRLNQLKQAGYRDAFIRKENE
ncbi:MAG: SPOR domain-containing protein [Acidobacteria bacterium]|nr:SPOR domain-containing protein [Acidobacteriota bacterium]